MDKTTVYLPLELKSAMRRVALRRGISEAELIRESIRREIQADRPPARGGLFAGSSPIAPDVDANLRGFGER